MTVATSNKFQTLENRIEEYLNRLSPNELEREEILNNAFKDERLFYYMESIFLESKNELKLSFVQNILENFKQYQTFFTFENLKISNLSDYGKLELRLNVEAKNLIQIKEGSAGSFTCKINTYSGPKKRAKTYFSPNDLERLPYVSKENNLGSGEYYVFSFSSKEELSDFFETQLNTIQLRLK